MSHLDFDNPLYTVSAKKLPFGDTTDQGPWFPTINGHVVGDDARCFWWTREECLAFGNAFVEKRKAFLSQGDIARETR